MVATWSTGFWGLSITFGRDAQLLSGRATTFTDEKPSPIYQAEVRAEPVRCDAEPEYPLAESQLVVRSVALVSGQTLELGKPIPTPERIGERTGTDGFEINVATSGHFAGASLCKVTTTPDGSIKAILMEFPPGMDVDSFVARLEAEMKLEGTRSSRPHWPTVSWDDWMTSLFVLGETEKTTVSIRAPRSD